MQRRGGERGGTVRVMHQRLTEKNGAPLGSGSWLQRCGGGGDPAAATRRRRWRRWRRGRGRRRGGGEGGGGEGGGGRGRRERQITGAASDETAPPQRKYTPSIAPIGATEGAYGARALLIVVELAPSRDRGGGCSPGVEAGQAATEAPGAADLPRSRAAGQSFEPRPPLPIPPAPTPHLSLVIVGSRARKPAIVARRVQRRARGQRSPHGLWPAVCRLHWPSRRQHIDFGLPCEGGSVVRGEGVGSERRGGSKSRGRAHAWFTRPLTPGEQGGKRSRSIRTCDARTWGGTSCRD